MTFSENYLNRVFKLRKNNFLFQLNFFSFENLNPSLMEKLIINQQKSHCELNS